MIYYIVTYLLIGFVCFYVAALWFSGREDPPEATLELVMALWLFWPIFIAKLFAKSIVFAAKEFIR